MEDAESRNNVYIERTATKNMLLCIRICTAMQKSVLGVNPSRDKAILGRLEQI